MTLIDAFPEMREEGRGREREKEKETCRLRLKRRLSEVGRLSVICRSSAVGDALPGDTQLSLGSERKGFLRYSAPDASVTAASHYGGYGGQGRHSLGIGRIFTSYSPMCIMVVKAETSFYLSLFSFCFVFTAT